MKIIRMSLAGVDGAVSPEAKMAMGVEDISRRCGRGFAVTMTSADGVRKTVQVDVIGEFCFIPAEVSEELAAQIAGQLEPMVETQEATHCAFMRSVFAGIVPGAAGAD